jgi:Ca2+-binding RTX toxin-like protein
LVHGGEGNDVLMGGLDADNLYGDAGDDYIDGGLDAADILRGGVGNDTIVYDAADATTVDGGDDIDTLILQLNANHTFIQLYTVPVNFEIIDLTKNGDHTITGDITSLGVAGLTGAANALTILKDTGDTITLATEWVVATNNTTEMLNGVDSPVVTYTNTANASTLKVVTSTAASTDVTHLSQEISGAAATGGDGHDLITGTTANDILTGGAGDDIMFGGTGDDIMSGGSGNDILMGDTGADTLNGGTGSDVMHGGTGGDTFEWNSGDTGNDFINDFSKGAATTDDVLDLSDLLVGESSTAESLDDYLDFSASAGGGTLITVDTNGLDDGGEGQTITLENITYASWGTTSDTDIITQMLSDNSLIVS